MAAVRNTIRPMAMANAFDGAATDAYSMRYTQTSAHPDEEAAQALPVLRARAVDLYRNDPLAYGVISTIRRGVVGSGPRRGPWHQPRLPGGLPSFGRDSSSPQDGTVLAPGQTSAMALWMPPAYLATSWYYSRMLATEPGRGSILSMLHESTRQAIGLRVCDVPPWCRLRQIRARHGVLCPQIRVPADRRSAQRLQLVSPGPKWPGQCSTIPPSIGWPSSSVSRITLLTPAIHDLKDLREYRKTEVRRATQAAKHTLIIETPDPKSISDAFENVEGSQMQARQSRRFSGGLMGTSLMPR